MNIDTSKLTSYKNKAQDKVEGLIKDRAYKSVVKDLKDSGIEVSDLSDDEFKELWAEEINKQSNLAKGAASAAGVLLFLDFLG